jgi:hypothetical protein
MKIPTDLEILKIIYTQYYSQFESFEKHNSEHRLAKVYVPIDVDLIGMKLGVDGDIVFGRLYHHFNNKYSYSNKNGSEVLFFALELNAAERKDKHCIQFPLMASILAELMYEHRKYKVATVVSVLSFIVSVVAVVISLLH